MSPVDTGPRFDPIAIGQVVARNLVPVVGILALDWSASTVLLLYFVDTMLSIGVIFAGLFSWFGRGSVEDRWPSRLNAEVGYVAGAAFLVAFIAVPLGMPLVFVGAWAGWGDVKTLFADPALQAGIAWQVVAAVWSYAGLWRELHVRSPEELRVKRRFTLLFLRWVVILLAVYSPIGWLFGRFLPHLLVALYAGASIFVEIAPDRFLRAMPGGADDADPLPGPAKAPPGKRRRR
jgi:hypothetical protein